MSDDRAAFTRLIENLRETADSARGLAFRTGDRRWEIIAAGIDKMRETAYDLAMQKQGNLRQ